MGHRYYDPATGRFTQPDPSKQEANAYLYVSGNPVNMTDPSGLHAQGCSSPFGDRPAGVDFLGACNVHDVCYQETLASRWTCDVVFFGLMRESCDGVDGWWSRFGCHGWANTYFTGVRLFGWGAYDNPHPHE